MRERKRTVIVARQIQVDDHFAGHIVARVVVSGTDTVTITDRNGIKIRKRGGTTMSVYREITDEDIADYARVVKTLDESLAQYEREYASLGRTIADTRARRARYALIAGITD